MEINAIFRRVKFEFELKIVVFDFEQIFPFLCVTIHGSFLYAMFVCAVESAHICAVECAHICAVR